MELIRLDNNVDIASNNIAQNKNNKIFKSKLIELERIFSTVLLNSGITEEDLWVSENLHIKAELVLAQVIHIKLLENVNRLNVLIFDFKIMDSNKEIVEIENIVYSSSTLIELHLPSNITEEFTLVIKV